MCEIFINTNHKNLIEKKREGKTYFFFSPEKKTSLPYVCGCACLRENEEDEELASKKHETKRLQPNVVTNYLGGGKLARTNGSLGNPASGTWIAGRAAAVRS